MLIDDVIIKVKAGNGGDGASTFLRTRTFKGGPDGGNGGDGGDVYFQGTDDLTALSQFRYKKELKAQDGFPGARKKMFGKDGEDLVIKIPVGTSIINLETAEQYEVNDTHFQFLFAKGGKGGRGNAEFKTAINQAPRYAEKGRKTPEVDVRLVLKLIADIGFAGLPNAGKSSLLKTLTNADPKIGDYPFTTLEPNLGVMDNLVLVDIPGIIEGASGGKGLGLEFLKHVEKTKLIVHCIDSAIPNLLEAYGIIRKEFELHNSLLLEKPEIVLLTKIDLISAEELAQKINLMKRKNKHVVAVSIYDQKRIENLKKLFVNYSAKNKPTLV
ncbi:MAG: hypothetical protein A2857_03915 [Candidatus Levybacteria bacterium RIFCSPHIGHO2_01_FULL_36_15]|nr:MAG: hypothetical protein A2857_03915 [Candidatus Levybacteria bacterium RIFCSPHIGHO2_01_FULL_36_15]